MKCIEIESEPILHAEAQKMAKRTFQLHGATGSGELLFRKRLT
jgi:hypothetical protein